VIQSPYPPLPLPLATRPLPGLRVHQKELLIEITYLYIKSMADLNYHQDLKKKNSWKIKFLGQNKAHQKIFKNFLNEEAK